MSHFYGTVQGGRGEATRTGHKTTGLTTTAASWSGAIRVRLYHDNGVDCYIVEQESWRGRGVYEPIAEGVLGEHSPQFKLTRAILNTSPEINNG
jgi:hypothetical protein